MDETTSGRITVAIAGNPNCGKTALFNTLTGGRQRVSNWPGVTVERRSGVCRHRGYEFEVVDLPGTYSLSPLTPDQLIARDYIVSGSPDVIVNIVDGSNLERNLYLTTQLLELGLPIVVAINMMDVVEKRGDVIETEALSVLLGCPVVPVVAVRKRGRDELLEAVVRVFEGTAPRKEVHVHYGKDLEKEIAKISVFLGDNPASSLGGPERWQAIKLVERDAEYQRRLEMLGDRGLPLAQLVDRSRERLRDILGHDPVEHIVEAAYGFAAGAIRETLRRNVEGRLRGTEKIDRVLTHRIWGLPIFGLILWLIFEVTFTLGEPFMGWIEWFFAWLGGLAGAAIPEGLLRSLVVDGIIGGVGGVLVFVPNILLLFVMISLLEDSGYMARGAFVMDRLMHRLGLHGKSFIPMIIGFGCTVPAVMAARTLENPKDRLVTILTVPLMSCGARLPVYILLVGAFFPATYAGTVIFGIYVLGIILAVLAARVFRRTIARGESVPFVMELPPYHVPTVKAVLLHAWQRAWMYIKKAGTIILIAMMVIWALTAFPTELEDAGEFETLRRATVESYLTTQEEIAAGLGLEATDGFEPTPESPYLTSLAGNAALIALVNEVAAAFEDFDTRVEEEELEEGFPGYGAAVDDLEDDLAELEEGNPGLYPGALELHEAGRIYREELVRIAAARETERLYHTPLGIMGRGVSVVMEPRQ